jgi:hypothetical protein
MELGPGSCYSVCCQYQPDTPQLGAQKLQSKDSLFDELCMRALTNFHRPFLGPFADGDRSKSQRFTNL